MRLRRKPRHGVKTPPQFENPARNWEFIKHMHSPWTLIAMAGFQIMMLILIMVLFGYAREFSDYLNQRGDFANRQRAAENQAICDLIAELHDNAAGDLQRIANQIGCSNSPLPPRTDVPASPTSVPIAPSGAYSTGHPTGSSAVPTGTAHGSHAAGNGASGTNVPARTSTAARPTAAAGPTASEPPPDAASAAPGGGSASATSPSSPQPSGPVLCIPLTNVCF